MEQLCDCANRPPRTSHDGGCSTPSSPTCPTIRSGIDLPTPEPSTTCCAPACSSKSTRCRNFLDELESLPTATAYGDACTRNLLLCLPDGRLARINFGFW